MNLPIKNILQNTLNQFPAIKLAIVFGSVAVNRENDRSDIDIAILADKPLDFTQKVKLIESLAIATGRPIDLIDLKTAGQPLLGQIISNGERVKGSDSVYAQLITRNLFDQADFLPYRNRILDERREAWIGK